MTHFPLSNALNQINFLVAVHPPPSCTLNSVRLLVQYFTFAHIDCHLRLSQTFLMFHSLIAACG